MLWRSTWISSLLVLGVVVIPACSSEEDDAEPPISPIGLAAQQCAQVVECDCGFTNDIEACTDSLSESFESVRNAADAAGLEYDADCAERQTKWIEELGCAIQNDELLLGASCALTCPLYHGYVGPGEACLVVAERATTCASGLECVNGLCEDICSNWRLAEGATCSDPVNPPTGTCVDGNHCDFGDTNRCIPTPQRGEPCPGNVCLEDDWCNTAAQPEAICEGFGAVGNTCLGDAACETGYCVDNLCAPYPTIGEPCSGECADDLYCQSGTCTVKQGLGQSCDFNLPCTSGLTCNGDVCEPGQPLVCFGSLF